MADAEARERALELASESRDQGYFETARIMEQIASVVGDLSDLLAASEARVAALEQRAEDVVEALREEARRQCREVEAGRACLDYEDRAIFMCPSCARIDAVLSARPTEETPEPREGIVTVRDHTGRYLGCMGSERWELLLAEDSARPTEETAG